MKKMIVIVMSVVLLLGLCACGQEAPAPTEPVISAQPKVEETAPVEATVPATEEATEAATEAAMSTEDRKALAESCIDKDVSELYALIGEPESSEYAPSCMVEGEDGALYYDGFVVYTTRVGDVETVYYVE